MTTTNEQKLSPVPLLQMATGFWVSNTLSSALELGLFSHLSGKSLSREELEKALGLQTRPARMLLAACASFGLIEKKNGLYSNSLLADTFLVKGKPYYFGGFVEMLQKRLYLPWYELTDALKKNKPKAAEISGPIYELFEKNPEMGRLFMGAMHSLSSFTAAATAEKVDLSGQKSVLDVGGGSGAWCIELAKAYPNLSFTLVDLPGITKIAGQYINEAGLEKRIKLHPGDFFEVELPKGHDVIILSLILHGFNPEMNETLLKRCYSALNPGGKLVIVELFLEDGETGPIPAALMSLNMLIELEGMNYTWAEHESRVKQAGFRNLTRIPLEGTACNGVLTAEK